MKKIIVLLFLFSGLTAIAQTPQKTFGFAFRNKSKDTDKHIEILEVLNKTDAQKKGLKPGNAIIEINNTVVEQLNNDAIWAIIQEAKKTGTLNLKIKNSSTAFTLKTTELFPRVCLSGNCINGTGKVQETFSFYEYEGGFINGQYDGQGTLTFKGVSKNYEGSKVLMQKGFFNSGKFSIGVMECMNGKYEGKFTNNIITGAGTYTDVGSSTTYKGNFNSKGLFEGVIVMQDKQGNMEDVEYANGVFVRSIRKYKVTGSANNTNNAVPPARDKDMEEVLNTLIKKGEKGFAEYLIEANRLPSYYNYAIYKTDIQLKGFEKVLLEKYADGKVKLVAKTDLLPEEAEKLFKKIKNDLVNTSILITSSKREESVTGKEITYRLKDKGLTLYLKTQTAAYDIDAPVGSPLKNTISLLFEKRN